MNSKIALHTFRKLGTNYGGDILAASKRSKSYKSFFTTVPLFD